MKVVFRFRPSQAAVAAHWAECPSWRLFPWGKLSPLPWLSAAGSVGPATLGEKKQTHLDKSFNPVALWGYNGLTLTHLYKKHVWGTSKLLVSVPRPLLQVVGSVLVCALHPRCELFETGGELLHLLDHSCQRPAPRRRKLIRNTWSALKVGKFNVRNKKVK